MTYIPMTNEPNISRLTPVQRVLHDYTTQVYQDELLQSKIKDYLALTEDEDYPVDLDTEVTYRMRAAMEQAALETLVQYAGWILPSVIKRAREIMLSEVSDEYAEELDQLDED